MNAHVKSIAANPILLMLEQAITRQQVENYLAKTAFKLVPDLADNTVHDFTKLSEDGGIVVADIGGLGAGNSADMLAEIRGPADLPLILLLSREEQDDLDDELRRRAAYCLITPVSEHNLNAILHATSAEHAQTAGLRHEVQQRTSAIGSIISGEFEIRTLDEARHLATMLSLACPEPETAAIGMMELMLNAIEHGNLGVSFDLKSELLAKGEWQSEIDRRLNLDENIGKKATIGFKKSNGQIEIRVSDEGSGFDKNDTMSRILDPFRTHGRGIQIAENQCFNSLEYQGTGSVVVAIIRTG